METASLPGQSEKNPKTLTKTISMGVGVLVGAGIFALLGHADYIYSRPACK